MSFHFFLFRILITLWRFILLCAIILLSPKIYDDIIYSSRCFTFWNTNLQSYYKSLLLILNLQLFKLLLYIYHNILMTKQFNHYLLFHILKPFYYKSWSIQLTSIQQQNLSSTIIRIISCFPPESILLNLLIQLSNDILHILTYLSLQLLLPSISINIYSVLSWYLYYSFIKISSHYIVLIFCKKEFSKI